MAIKAKKSNDLGQLQDEVTQATQNFKTARTNLLKAQEAFDRAETQYHATQKTLEAGVSQLKAATKIV